MAASQRPDPKDVPQYPGSGQPRVPQPGQFVPANPGQPVINGPRTAVPSQTVVRHVTVPGKLTRKEYVDPILFKEGVFEDKADYKRAVKRNVALIKSGKVEPREPDVN